MDFSRVYELKNKENSLCTVVVEGVLHTDVAKIFDCGQCFRFEPVTDSKHEKEFSGVAFGKFVSFAQDGDRLTIYNSTKKEFDEIWCGFLCLDENYSDYISAIKATSDVPALARAIEFGDGIRILRQDMWECVCSFIISQNNNIPRIKKLVEAVSKAAGEPVDVSLMKEHGAGDEAYAFPTPEKLSELGIDGLAALKTGFRAKYLYDAAERVCDGRLVLSDIADSGKIPQTADAQKALCEVKGIGPKVACCILLFAAGRYDAFPIDVWIKRVLAAYFPENFDPQNLGATAGIAQQFLFYYERFLGGDSAT